MTRRLSTLLSYPYVPWWHFRFCEDALRDLADVTFIGTAGFGRPGFPLDMDIGEYLATTGATPDFYLSGEVPLHRGICDLKCPTAMIIGDYWPGNVGRIQTARLFDHVFVTDQHGMRDFPKGGCKSVHWLPFGADTRFHRDFQMERIYEVGFVGFTNQQRQQDRANALAALAALFKMNDYKQRAVGEEVGRIYSQSKIVVNFPQDGGFNMRVFEAMACGAMLITEDVGNGQDELFQDKKHLILYRSRDEISALVKHYLEHDDERRAIAAEGQREVLAKHTYRHRMEFMLEVLSEVGHERNRTQDKDEIARVYAMTFGRAGRMEHLLREIFLGNCSLKTRLHVFARLLKAAYSTVFPPKI